MKKAYLFIFTVVTFFIMGSVSANTIDRIDIDINIDQNGAASITEVWDVDGSDGTEWYKGYKELGNSELTDFTVSMDGKQLTYKKWNISESLSEKKGYYGINYTDSGLELCFGKYDYNHHIFTLNYKLSNYIINTDDSQVLYWTLIDHLSNVTFKNFSVTVSSYYELPDELDVWGYGYKGYAYVEGGKIKMSNEGNMGSNNVVLLAKFPLNTFNTTNTKEGYNTFDDIYNLAEQGSYKYDYNDSNLVEDIISIIITIFTCALPFIIAAFVGISVYKNGYGYKDNKKIDKKNVPKFRDIPCDKNLFYANTLIKLNNFGYKETNIFGALILKWLREDKISFKNETKGVFNKNTSSIDLTKNPEFETSIERKIFGIMYEASKDGILETKELEKWARSHYSSFFNSFSSIIDDEINHLKSKGHIYKRTNKQECKFKNVMDDTIYEESIKLYGLKSFLEEFSRMDHKEAIEVKLWDEYLMFAYLFGIADKVAKQFKNLYPEIIKQMEQSNFDYATFAFVDTLSTKSFSAASSARAAAQSYSSGGGGFSSGGGGGGSFGGGGGGGSR